jgi:hypothetical protein
MLAIQLVPHNSASWLQTAWIIQGFLTVIAVIGMIGRLLRHQRKLDA